MYKDLSSELSGIFSGGVERELPALLCVLLLPKLPLTPHKEHYEGLGLDTEDFHQVSKCVAL